MVENNMRILLVFAIILSISFFVIALIYLRFVEKRVMAQIAAEKARESEQEQEQPSATSSNTQLPETDKHQ